MQLNGNVKSIQTNIYEAVAANNRIVKGRLIGDWSQLNNIKLFNNCGNISEERYYFTDGYLAHTEKVNYDSLNRLIEKNIIYERERFNEKTIYKFNNHGKLIEKSTYEFDNSLNAKEEFKYDSNNTLIEHRFYFSKLREITEYISDSQAIIQANVYDMDEGKKLKSVRIFNDNVIEESINNSDGSIKFKYFIEYDNKSRKIEVRTLDSNLKLIERITYKYYSDSKLP